MPGPGANRIVWITIVLLIIVLVIAGEVGKKTKVSAVAPGMRAVVVPTADASRTVVVPPCGTGTSVVSSNLPVALSSPGTVVVQFPQGQGTRLVLVPKCTAVHPGETATSHFPSAAFVTKPGTNPPPIGTAKSISTSSSSSIATPQSAQFEVSVPAGSPVKTIIVPPCQRLKGSGPAETILGTTSGSTTAVAPAC
jgi:hypothetical protein